jgi:hypothetical protein
MDREAVIDAIEDAIHRPYHVESVREVLASDYFVRIDAVSLRGGHHTTRLIQPVRESWRHDLDDDESLRLPTWCHYDAALCLTTMYEYSNDPPS